MGLEELCPPPGRFCDYLGHGALSYTEVDCIYAAAQVSPTKLVWGHVNVLTRLSFVFRFNLLHAGFGRITISNEGFDSCTVVPRSRHVSKREEEDDGAPRNE